MEEDQGQNLEVAIDNLHSVERKMSKDGDVEGSRKAVVDILKLCYEAGEWNKLNEQIVLLFKRRGLSTEVKKTIVSKVSTYILTTDAETQTELFKTINSVTAGKKDFELGRAQLIRKLALHKNEQGLFTDAANMIMGVEVEPIDKMDKFEKTQFILDQVRLCLDNHDYVRAKIVSGKISPKGSDYDYYLDKGVSFFRTKIQLESYVDLQQSFYQLMIRYHSHSNDYLEISRCYKSLYEIPSLKQLIDRSHTHSNDSSDNNNDLFYCWCHRSIDEIETVKEEDPAQRMLPLLRKICWYLVLSPHGLEQSQLLISTLENDKNLSEIPRFKSLLKSFATMEVIQWNAFWNTFKDEFEDEKNIIDDLPDDCSLTEKQAEVLKLRDIRVIATYYSRITMKRLADLLALSVQEAEKHLCDMVVSKSVFAKIDRPLGVVCFQKAKDANEILDSWAHNLEKLLNIVDKTCDKIHTEMK